MTIAHIIETCTTAAILALTPQERWGSATKGLSTSGTTIPKWFIISAVSIVTVLIASSIIAVIIQKAHKR